MRLRLMGFQSRQGSEVQRTIADFCGLRRPIRAKRCELKSELQRLLIGPFWLGLIWVVSRIIYAIGYAQVNTQMRGPGVGLGFFGVAGSARAVGDRPYIDPRAIPLRIKKI